MSSVLGGFAGLGGPSIGRAVVDMVLDAKAYNAELAATEAETKAATGNMGKGFAGFQKSITSSFSTAQKGLVVFGAVAAVSIAKAVGVTQDWAAEVRTLQRVTGTSAEATSKLGAAGKLLNLDMSKLNTGFGILGKNIINESANLTKYGVALKDAQGNTLPFDQILSNLSDKFLTLQEGPERTAFAMNVFGRSGKELIPILARGSAGLEELKQKAEDAGLVMSQDALDASKNLGIAERDLGEAAKGAGIKLGTAFLPVLTVVAESLTKLVELVQKIPTPVLAIGAAFGVIASALLIAKKAWTALQASMSTGIGVMGAWVLAAASVVVAAQKVFDFLQKDDKAAQDWNEHLKNNDYTLRQLQQAVTQVVDATHGFGDTATDKVLLDAFAASAVEMNSTLTKLYAETLPNASAQSREFTRAMIESEAFTVKQNQAVADLLLGLDSQGVSLDKATEKQLHAAITAGKYNDVISILRENLGLTHESTGALGDATRDLAKEQEQAAAAAARHATRLIELRQAQLETAGGILGLVTAGRSLQEAQAKVNDLQKQGKEDTKAYRDAVADALSAELTFKGAVFDVKQQLVDHNLTFKEARDQLFAYGKQAGLAGDDLRNFVNDSLKPLRDQLGPLHDDWAGLIALNPKLFWSVNLQDNFDIWLAQLKAKLVRNGISGGGIDFQGGGSGTGGLGRGLEGGGTTGGGGPPPTPPHGNRDAATTINVNGDVYAQDADSFARAVNNAARRTANKSVLI